MPSKTPTLDDLLHVGDTSGFKTVADVSRADQVARERPSDLTDDEIALLAEYDRGHAARALDSRTKARAAAANPPTPAPTPAPSVQIARWLKGETREEFLTRCRTHAVSLSYLASSLNALNEVLVERFNGINAKNIERNNRLTSLETRLAGAEARLGGHNGSPEDERLAAIENWIAELRSQQAIDSERIKQIEGQPTALAYQGVFVHGKTYQRGQFATSGGSLWHANKITTAKPGDGSGDWTLAVKKGSDGKSTS
jgi:hypothetical protein